MTSPKTRPLRRDAERNRQLILRAAQELFADRGLDVSLDEIAAHAGLGVGTVYRRFPTKEDLVEALFEDRLRELLAIAQRALAHPDPWQGVVNLLEEGNALHSTDRGLREVVLGSRFGHDHVARIRDGLQPVVTELVPLYREFNDIPLISIMIGAVVDYAGDMQPDIWRRFLAIIIDGLRAGTPEATPMQSAALTPDEVDRTMRSWHPRRR